MRSTHEWWRLGIALTGAAVPASPDRAGEAYDLDDAKGIIELLCRRLRFAHPTFTPLTDDPTLHPGRARSSVRGGRRRRRSSSASCIRRVVEALDLRAERIYVAELAVAGLAGGQPREFRVAAPSRFPSVERDLAVVVPVETPAGSVAGRRSAATAARSCAT